MSRPKDVQMRKGSGVIAICFHPGMAYKFIQIPMHALSDTTAALADIWGCIATQIEDEIAECSSNKLRVSLLQKYLFKKLANDKNDLQIAHSI